MLGCQCCQISDSCHTEVFMCTDCILIDCHFPSLMSAAGGSDQCGGGGGGGGGGCAYHTLQLGVHKDPLNP